MVSDQGGRPLRYHWDVLLNLRVTNQNLKPRELGEGMGRRDREGTLPFTYLGEITLTPLNYTFLVRKNADIILALFPHKV